MAFEAEIQQAIEEAERACEDAVKNTPAEYQSFLMFIGQRKRVGGSRQNPVYANIRLPYMRVDGRVKMAMDEHRLAGKRLNKKTTFQTLGDRVVVRIEVESEIYGNFDDYAEVFFGGSGVDSTNPVENAVTSAYGRALGAMGYGLYGTGIASAEEVQNAIGRRENMSLQQPTREEAKGSASNMTQSGSGPERPASPKQLGFLKGLITDWSAAHRVYVHDRAMDVAVYNLSSSRASLWIKELQEADRLPGGVLSYHLKLMAESGQYGISHEDISEHMRNTYGENRTYGTLTAQEQCDVINWVISTSVQSDDDDIPDPPARSAEAPKGLDQAHVELWDAAIAGMAKRTGLSPDGIRYVIASTYGDGDETLASVDASVRKQLTAMGVKELTEMIDAGMPF